MGRNDSSDTAVGYFGASSTILSSSSAGSEPGENFRGTSRFAPKHDRGVHGVFTRHPISCFLRRCATYQNENLSENWISRGVPTTEVIAAEPPVGATNAAAGFANDG
jgi:hypothetical protein